MLLKVVTIVDIDTTDTDIEDIRKEILKEASKQLKQDSNVEIEPVQ